MFKIFLATLLLTTSVSAGELVCPPSAPVVDLEAKFDGQQDYALLAFDRQVTIVAAKPKVEDIDELVGTVRRLADLENKSMSEVFRLTSGKSVRSVPSSEMEAHLDAIKALRRAQELLKEARESAESHVSHEAQLRLAAAAKEVAKARKHIAERRKARPKKKAK